MSERSVAVVTGASSGIGRAFALELVRRDWAVIPVGRDATTLTGIASEPPLVADLATQQGVRCVVDVLRDSARNVRLLVNAAGLATSAPFGVCDLADEERMLAVNVSAVLALSHAAVGAMRERPGAAVVNVSSTAAYWSVGTYAAGKSWVLLASQDLAAQTPRTGVRVLAVVPGFTRSQFHQRSRTDASGVRSWLWLSPDTVAREALDALAAGHTTWVPARRYRALTRIARRLPDGVRARLLHALAPLRTHEPSNDNSENEERTT